MSYSYVGAPWVPEMKYVIHDDTRVGNGGLSLRNKDTMLSILNQPQLQYLRQDSNEDVFFSIGVNRFQLNPCPVEVASSFSVEQVYHPNPFGWHQAYKWLPEHWDILSMVVLDIQLLYGINDTFIDITPQDWDSIRLHNYNDVGGDPVPGIVKELRIISQDLDNKPGEIRVSENTPITISRFRRPIRAPRDIGTILCMLSVGSLTYNGQTYNWIGQGNYILEKEQDCYRLTAV